MGTLLPKIKERITRFYTSIHSIVKTFSPEKVLTLYALVFLSTLSFFFCLVSINKSFLIKVPIYGGSVREGIVGTPRFINPVLATSEQDKDLTSLLFAGLTKKTEDGTIVPDVAESISESEDGLQYDIVIKKDAVFHDDSSVTADDLIYTINMVQNPTIKSPYRILWEGVEVQKKGERELTLTLKKPFPLFMETLTLGILPKHVWKNLNEDQFSLSDLNIHAIGCGPYALTQVVTESGIPVAFELTAHEEYTLGRPYIQNIFISSYQNEKYLIKAFQDGDITRVHGLSPEKIATLQLPETAIKTSLLPRTFAVFFNPNKLQPLADKNIRKALELAINKKAIVDTVLYGYGKPLSGPYPFDANATSSEYNKEEAKDLISKSKLIKNASSTLDITLVTANTDEMKKVAELIKADWEAVGVHTTISIYDVSDLNQSIIKDREFQALLFGAITETPSDLYAFWHSSQRSYPGLNVSNYVSKTLDENLEILRNSRDKDEQKDAYTSVLKEFEEETPGIFLYSPKLLYIVKDKVTTILPQYSYDNSSRFQSVQEWYRFTDTVWPKTYYKKAIEIIENIIH